MSLQIANDRREQRNAAMDLLFPTDLQDLTAQNLLHHDELWANLELCVTQEFIALRDCAQNQGLDNILTDLAETTYRSAYTFPTEDAVFIILESINHLRTALGAH